MQDHQRPGIMFQCFTVGLIAFVLAFSLHNSSTANPADSIISIDIVSPGAKTSTSYGLATRKSILGEGY